RYCQLLGRETALPPDGYQGEYVTDIARNIIERGGDRYKDLPLKEQAKLFAPMGVEWVVKDDQRVCAKFGIHFDEWFSQAEMMRSGYFEETIGALKRHGTPNARRGRSGATRRRRSRTRKDGSSSGPTASRRTSGRTSRTTGSASRGAASSGRSTSGARTRTTTSSRSERRCARSGWRSASKSCSTSSC